MDAPIKNRKLGKLAPRKDARTLRLSRFLRPGLPTPPDSVNYAKQAGVPDDQWGMMKNDELGNCTIASKAHLIKEWNALAGRVNVVPSDDQILAAYVDVSGYNPATGENDDGAAMLDTLKYWRTTGIGGHRIALFGQIDPNMQVLVKLGIYLFEGLDVGVALPNTAQNQEELWDIVPDAAVYDSAAGSWGGHDICAVGYDTEGVFFLSWGKLMKMTWAFWSTYVDEAYATISEDMLLPGGKIPLGMDVPAMQRELYELTGVAGLISDGKKIALVVGGDFMTPDDKDVYWELVAELKEQGYDEVRTVAWNELKPEHLVGVKLAIVYSYGCGAMWDCLIRQMKGMAIPQIAMLIIVAGVPNSPDFGQFYGSLWHAPANFERAVCFNVTAIPASCSLQNEGAVNYDISKFQPGAALPNDRYININADSVVNWFGRHQMIKASQVVHGIIARFGKKVLEL